MKTDARELYDVTSAWWKVADRDAAAASPEATFKSTMWMSHVPREQSACATARPMPEAPPVIIATFWEGMLMFSA